MGLLTCMSSSLDDIEILAQPRWKMFKVGRAEKENHMVVRVCRHCFAHDCNCCKT